LYHRQSPDGYQQKSFHFFFSTCLYTHRDKTKNSKPSHLPSIDNYDSLSIHFIPKAQMEEKGYAYLLDYVD